MPFGIEVMEAVARMTDPEAIVWRGEAALHSVDQGVRILGTPWGTQTCTTGIFDSDTRPVDPDGSAAGLAVCSTVLLYCCAARANHT